MFRQVPTHYLIIGNGRVARHLAHYFSLEKIPFLQWSRIDSNDDLHRLIPFARRILLAIKDDAIELFCKENLLPPEKTIHFSGALQTPCAQQLHPLMTFSTELYTHDDYLRIPFVSEINSPPLRELIPELKNSNYQIPSGLSPLYHALCVLAGNGTTVLWQKIFSSFEQELALPPSVLIPYLEKIVENLKSQPKNALTGPWARNDQNTILKNKSALKNSSFLNLYSTLSETQLSQTRSFL